MNQGEITPNSCCSIEYNPTSSVSSGGNFTGSDYHTTWFEIEKQEALLGLQQMVNRYNECFKMLKDTVTAVDILRLENLQLVKENLDLESMLKCGPGSVSFDSPTGCGSGSGSEVISGCGGSGSRSGSEVVSGSGGSGTGSGSEVITGSGGSGSGSGSEVASSGLGGGVKAGGVPKSISIRSRGYLASEQKPAGGAHRLRLPFSPAVHGDENQSGEVEVEVYNQGTTKTELCNKWEKEGACPYGDRCRFAHGMNELRPVIRHPRYKTQLCRMMGAGGDCPYGHRCHFRHALAPRIEN